MRNIGDNNRLAEILDLLQQATTARCAGREFRAGRLVERASALTWQMGDGSELDRAYEELAPWEEKL
jgi:hypothetical protein